MKRMNNHVKREDIQMAGKYEQVFNFISDLGNKNFKTV